MDTQLCVSGENKLLKFKIIVTSQLFRETIAIQNSLFPEGFKQLRFSGLWDFFSRNMYIFPYSFEIIFLETCIKNTPILNLMQHLFYIDNQKYKLFSGKVYLKVCKSFSILWLQEMQQIQWQVGREKSLAICLDQLPSYKGSFQMLIQSYWSLRY